MEKLIFDCHAHYFDSAFDGYRDKLLEEELPFEGVCGVVNSGADVDTSQKSIDLSKKYSYCFSTIGVHPENANDSKSNFIEELEELLRNNKKIVGIGEIGLDYHFSSGNCELQKNIFIRQIELSNKYNLPIVVHDRDVHKDTLNIIKNYSPKGMVHCFSGDLKMANDLIDRGMFLGIGGIVTFKNAENLREIVKNIPLGSILLETDAPYLSPVPHRGKTCKSSYIKYVAEKIADIKNISSEEVLGVTKQNSLKLFNIVNAV